MKLRYDVADGAFELTTSSVANIFCEMEFHLYPFDTQSCMLRIRTAKDMSQQVKMLAPTFSYDSPENSFQKMLTTIDQKSDNLHDGKFDLFIEPLKINWFYASSRHENISLSGFTAVLKRSSAPYLINTYLPTGMLTLASFIGFLIPVEMVPGRMALLVTIFLMLVNIRSTEKRTGPIVSYFIFWNVGSCERVSCPSSFQAREITAMDTWLLISMIFVAMATFEYAVLLALRFGRGKKINSMGDEFENKEERCYKVDRISFILFMVVYILIVVVYFIVVTQNNI